MPEQPRPADEPGLAEPRGAATADKRAEDEKAPPEKVEDKAHAHESSLRLVVGRDLVALGFVLILAAFALAVAFFRTATDVATVLAPVTTLVGSLIGAMFGVQAGNQARAQESHARDQAEQRTAEAVAKMDPAVAEPLVKEWARRRDSGIGNPTEADFS